MAHGNDLKFQNRPATESASKDGNDRTHEREHAGDTTAADAKTLDFSPRSEFQQAQAVSLPSPLSSFFEKRLEIAYPSRAPIIDPLAGPSKQAAASSVQCAQRLRGRLPDAARL